MAKRKRKSSGGGAFGKSGARRLPEIEPKIGEDEGLVVDRNRPSADQERRIAVATRQMAWLKERSEEERTELADALFNLSPEAFFERYDPEPEAHFRATKHLEEGVDNEEDDEGMRKRVIEALAIDPDCVDAHLLLAEMSRDAESKLGHCQDAVAAGERKHQAVLAAAGDGPVDPALELLDRPYLEALHDLANYRWMNADREGSKECYQRMLDLEPKDFHDVISALIALAFAAENLDEVSRFLDAASIQGSTSVLFGRALRAFRIAMEEFPDFMPDMTSPEPFAALQSPGMRIARELLSHAVQSAPWAVSFVLDPRVLVLRPVMSYSIGDPFDALEFARLNFLNWTLKVLPAVWLITEFGGSPPTQATERRLRQHHLAFSEARDLLDEIECPDLGGDEIREFARQFSDIAEDIGGLLEERGESPKGRRFRR